MENKAECMRRISRYLGKMHDVVRMYEEMATLAETSTTAFPEHVADVGNLVCSSLRTSGLLAAQAMPRPQVRVGTTTEPLVASHRCCARCGEYYVERREPWPVFPMCKACEEMQVSDPEGHR